MTVSVSPATTRGDSAMSVQAGAARITSVDAVRGVVMFTMIFVNDIAGVPDTIVPAWMKHFHGKSGMTFVDLVFPGFLFIVGMSIPFALGSRLKRGQPLWRILLHVLGRTCFLMTVGILMVNGTPDSTKMGWSGTLWSALMYLCAIFAFCTISSRSTADPEQARRRKLRIASAAPRILGLAGLVYLAFAFRGQDGHRIISLSPLSIHTEWYGILGLIGWAYLVGAVVFLSFRCHRTALLGCVAMLMCLYPAERSGAFEYFWLAHYVGIGGTLGSQAAITVAGLLLATILIAPELDTIWWRTRFALLFIGGCAAGALLLNGLYGINKNNATPSWCLWACAITAAMWLVFYFVADIHPVKFISKPFAVAGENVLLAYLISNLLPSVVELLRLGDWYSGLATPGLAHAIARSAGTAVLILSATAALNRAGFRLKI